MTPTTASGRLQAALAAGTRADPAQADDLIAQSGTEPDFFVRDMLTWALTRLPPEVTVPRLRAELRSPHPQARSQALHTLSKIGDRAAWPGITRELLRDPDDEVARTAWRTAVVLVPGDEGAALAAELLTQLGRGDRDVRRSLSQALVALGDVSETPLRRVAEHARTTLAMLEDPDHADR
ncbi:HEAT repeat domain-containing protein [Symbioplanes lichenis]|uniref:HEAT repeat domain-containing protein n=1 Tax=Symbioplanes lichenis TaxID=1629072 RepID=UPI002738383F|nr:HEAT repeat domain-containing protein [Actinoplanes lichenis]